MSAHVSAGVLNVYLLQRDGAQWKVLERFDGKQYVLASGVNPAPDIEAAHRDCAPIMCAVHRNIASHAAP